jgi:regulatory protein
MPGIMDSELQKAILKKAGRLLAHRAYSRGELRKKLAPMAEDSEIESALNRLEQLKLLNDVDYAYNFALYRVQQQGWGPAKVREHLFRRHLSRATIDSALERIRTELDEESVLLEYIKKHCAKRALRTDPKDIQKLIMHLRRRGFEGPAIFRALKSGLPEDAIHCFETGE